MTDSIRMYQLCRDRRCQDRSYYQQLKHLQLFYVTQWRYDKAKEIAGQIEALYVDRAANIRRTLRQASVKVRQHSRRQTVANEEVGEQQFPPATGVRFRSLS